MNRAPRAFGLALAIGASAFAAPGRAQDLAAEKAAAEKAAVEAKAAARMCEAVRDRWTDNTDPPHRRPTIDPSPEAVAFDGQGKGREAVAAYAVAACDHHKCRAAKRLGEIYSKGLLGIPVNYAESLKWNSMARVLGCDILLAPKPPVVTPASSSAFKAAVALEAEGEPRQAMNAYRRAAPNDCEAARRLGEIYSMGFPRDYAESLKWYNKARVLGCDVPMITK